MTAAVFVVAIAMVVFAFFLSALRRALTVSSRDGQYLSVVTIIGGAVYIGGMLVGAVFQLSLVDAAHHHQADVIHTLNFLSQDDFIPFIAGLATLALGTGIAGLRGRALPPWLAWASVGLGILALAGPLGGIAFIITPVWTLAVGIVLARRPADGDATVSAEARPPSVQGATTAG